MCIAVCNIIYVCIGKWLAIKGLGRASRSIVIVKLSVCLFVHVHVHGHGHVCMF